MQNIIKTIEKNRCLSFSVIAFILILLFLGSRNASARIFGEDEVVLQAPAVDNVAVHMILPALTAATSTVLVDISDNSNFKHTPTSGAIEISQIRITNTSDVAATTTVKLGLLASTTPSGSLSDIYWFDEVSFVTVGTAGTGRPQIQVLDYSPGIMNLAFASGAPSKLVTSDKSLSSSLYATTTSYTSPRGTFTVKPGAGDLVMSVYDQKGTATTSVTVLYNVRQ